MNHQPRARRFPFLVTLVLVSAAACRHAPPAHAGSNVSSDDVWLTGAEIARLNLSLATVAARPIAGTLRAGGRVAFVDTAVGHVYAPVSGRIASIDAGLGARVRRGDALATLRSPEIAVVTADVRRASADVVTTAPDLLRVRQLIDIGSATPRELEQVRDGYDRAVAELARARARSTLLVGDAAHGVTDTFTLRAPVDGEVVARVASPGAEVQGVDAGGTPVELFTVASIETVWVLFDVFEEDLARVHVGSPAHIETVAYPGRTFEARVDWIAPMLDPTTHTARARCVLANVDHVLRPEMVANVRVEADARALVAVPRTSVTRIADRDFVFVRAETRRDGSVRFRRTPVAADDGDADWSVITRGLAVGDVVVTAHAMLLGG